MKYSTKVFVPLLFFMLFLGIIVFFVYWTQIRPSAIYSICNKMAIAEALHLGSLSPDGDVRDKAKDGIYSQNNYNVYYNRCLRASGLNPTNVKDNIDNSWRSI